MSRKKKVLIGAGVVVVLGAVAFANFKFKRTEGTTVNTEAVQKRKLEAIVSAAKRRRTANCPQPRRSVHGSSTRNGTALCPFSSGTAFWPNQAPPVRASFMIILEW